MSTMMTPIRFCCHLEKNIISIFTILLEKKIYIPVKRRTYIVKNYPHDEKQPVMYLFLTRDLDMNQSIPKN